MKAKILLLLALTLLLGSCSKIVLQSVNYAWILEDKLVADNDGLARAASNKNVPTFNILSLLELEQEQNNAVTIFPGQEFRIIRGQKGYYFVTAALFKNVYVFSPGEQSLELYNTIPVSTAGLENPKFNQRSPFVQLLSGEEPLLLNAEGIKQQK